MGRRDALRCVTAPDHTGTPIRSRAVKWLQLNVARPSTRYRPTSTTCDAKVGEREMRRNCRPAGCARQCEYVTIDSSRRTRADWSKTRGRSMTKAVVL